MGEPHSPERRKPVTETNVTIVGNLTADPELRFTQAGTAVANFTVASAPRKYNQQTQAWEDGEALFMRCNVWREHAENVAESLSKGMRVIAQGRLRASSYEDKNGERRTSWQLEVDEVGPALKYARAQVSRMAPNQPQQQGAYQQQSGGQAFGQQPAANQNPAPPQPQAPQQPQQQGWPLDGGQQNYPSAPPF